MSDIGIVIVIGVFALGFGLAGAVRFGPPSPPGRAGALLFWTSRLVAAAATAAFALDVYAAIRRQTEKDVPSDAAGIDLADSLTRVLYDAGVLFALAVGLAVVGTLLIERSDVSEGDGEPGPREP